VDDYFAFLQHVAPLCLQWPLAQHCSAPWVGCTFFDVYVFLHYARKHRHLLHVFLLTLLSFSIFEKDGLLEKLTLDINAGKQLS
jgi:hypothetical protein